jgi:serine/threonine protein kinase
LRISGCDKDIKIGVKNNLLYNIVGVLPYIPPEMIFVKGYSHSANLWKLGVCAYYLLLGAYPFSGNSSKQVFY